MNNEWKITKSNEIALNHQTTKIFSFLPLKKFSVSASRILQLRLASLHTCNTTLSYNFNPDSSFDPLSFYKPALPQAFAPLSECFLLSITVDSIEP